MELIRRTPENLIRGNIKAGMMRYHHFSHHLKEVFGERVWKVPLDAGFTCPNRDGRVGTGGCIYCSEGSNYLPHPYKRLPIREQLISSISKIRGQNNIHKFIAYFQAYSNTYCPLHTLKGLYDEALNIDGVVGLSIGTRPDCLSDETLNLIEEYGAKTYLWLEIGLQSIHNRTLKLINRGHTFEQFLDAVKRAKGRGFSICIHVILGFPGETPADMMETAKVVRGLGIQGIKFHQLQVLRGTPLEELYFDGKIKTLDEYEYVNLVCDFLEFLPYDIIIQRLVGDAPMKKLIAPLWSLKKTDILMAIDGAMERRGSYQGVRS